ncbi:MAG: PadR family transcriptional regulator [Deltaproteobacteria bacterium]|nr:PadR family transcriptional regulator [Deltaproteobacteria bacterium]
MSVKYALLGILSERERHGYELKAAFDERVGEFWSLNYGQIYTTLDRLEREGLVERRDEPQARRPDRKIYRVTSKGRRELESWLGRPVARPRALRDELFIKLLFRAGGDVDPVLDLVHEQKEVYLGHLRRLTQRKFALAKQPQRDDRLVTDLLIDAALFHAEADVRWLAHAEQKLRAASRRRARPREESR